MTDQLKSQLAAALKIDPADIMRYLQTAEDAYTVLLTNYQKHTNVRPIEPDPKPEPNMPEETQIRNPKPVLSEAEVSDIPNHLKSAYQNPESAKKSDLAQLAVLLDLPLDIDNPLKKDLVAAIEAYKEQPYN